MIVLNLIVLFLSLVLLIRFSDVFVDAVISLAQRFKVPKMVIALTIAAFCTCAPELAISFNSISSGNVEMTLANVIGSSIVNILLIIGVAAIVRPIKVTDRTIKKELPLLLIITTAFFFLISDSLFVNSASNSLNRADGVMLLVWFVAFCFYIYSITKGKREFSLEKPKFKKSEALIITLISVFGIIIASDLVVETAVYVAKSFNISQKIIAMTVIVIGTSLPELVITTVSAKKGEFDVALGNIIGTNIFNICIVLGLPVVIYGTISSTAFTFVDIFVVLISALLLFIFGRSDKELSRREGILMVLTFIAYYAYIFIK